MALRKRARRFLAGLVHWTVLIGFAVLLAFPFYWMLITAFKQTGDLYNLKHNPFVFNQRPTLEHLRLLFQETLFLRWLGNTAFAGICVVAITLLLAVPAAYALARLTGSIILVYPTFTIPFSTWLLMGFFKSIPGELEDAAMVDGLTRFQTFRKLVIPISVSGILTVVIFSFTLVTQEFVYALTFISSAEHETVGLGVPIFLVRGDVYYWGSLMAACLIATLPTAVLYNLFLDRFIAGFTVGAVK
jgi:multiple sugar transport system permease protein